MNKKEPLILAVGDLALMAIALWATLVIRYGQLPSPELIDAHGFAFAIVFALSLVSFYISGLYSRMIHVARSALPGNIIAAQAGNAVIAVILFYFVPSMSVTPKVNLFIYIALSTFLIVLWRLNTQSILSLRKKYPALVIGGTTETDELIEEMGRNPRLGLYCREKIRPEDLSAKLLPCLAEGDDAFQYIVADIDDPAVRAVMPDLYRLYFAKATILDLHELYEEAFDRIPLSRMDHGWVMSRVSMGSPAAYDILKRASDIVLAIIVAAAALTAYPFVALAIKLEDGGPVLIYQERIGMNGRRIHIAKFRSMQRNESDKWVAEGTDNKVTRVGRFIRKTRIDELPQALAILRGDMSLIGPRADVAGLAARLEKEIPYYAVRTVIAPGLTGWAQINQEKPPQSVEETRLRMSYDLYYITRRSLSLDLRIALRTMKTLLSRAGM